jgi:hypothetical protein
LGILLAAGVISLAFTPTPVTVAAAVNSTNPFCARLGHSIQASAGAQMYCFGAKLGAAPAFRAQPLGPSSSANVNAASLAEDVSPNGVRGYGQSETSIGAAGNYVVEAWNDSTAFFSPCGSPMNKEELTGFAFSNDGGKTFTDLGGLPNSDCANSRYGGDPSVQPWSAGGKTYFYISSLFNDISGTTGISYIAFAACVVNGSGSTAALSCGQPVKAAQSTECLPASPPFPPFCSFLDKDFLTLDASRGRLYASYTEFGFSSFDGGGAIELAVCDIGKPNGAAGPDGGTASMPVCPQGQATTTPVPYYVVAPTPTSGCENEGAYPATSANGDVYVAYEANWASNLSGCPDPTRNVTTHTPSSCLMVTLVSPCSSGPDGVASVNIVSMDSAFIPGYNRFPMNDFPRIAVSDAHRTVSIVWNDASLNPLGDILLQSYHLGAALSPVQATPARINSRTGGANFLPGLRNATSDGRLQVSWYSRKTANTALTDVQASSVNPNASGPTTNVKVTTVATNWLAVSSDIIPNFGDYTDNFALGSHDYVAWSDGRLGEPQPYCDRR